MALSKNLVRRYQNAYKQKFNEGISEKDAEKELLDLIALINILTKERRHNHGK